MKMRALVPAALAAIVAMAAGCVLYDTLATDTVEYMGLMYGPSEHALLAEGQLYFTGETSGGAKLYAAGWLSPQKVPPLLFKKDVQGAYRPYHVLADNPPVYAYTPYVRYNLGEPVTIGLMNEAGGKIELRDSAPYEVQKKEGGEWKTVYHPVAAQVITSLENGTFKEWTWDQRLDNGSMASFGDYHIVINGEYEVGFRISKGSPAVESTDVSYDNGTINKICWNCPQHEAFKSFYHGRFINGTYDSDHEYSNALLDDVESEMLFKAFIKGENVTILKNALNISIGHSRGLDLLPCLAVHLSFNGRPSWAIVYNWGIGAQDDYYHIRYYAIDDETGQILYFTTCL
jgi:hypothetical protein